MIPDACCDPACTLCLHLGHTPEACPRLTSWCYRCQRTVPIASVRRVSHSIRFHRKGELAPDVREVSGRLACGHPKTWIWTAAELRLLAVEKERG